MAGEDSAAKAGTVSECPYGEVAAVAVLRNEAKVEKQPEEFGLPARLRVLEQPPQMRPDRGFGEAQAFRKVGGGATVHQGLSHFRFGLGDSVQLAQCRQVEHRHCRLIGDEDERGRPWRTAWELGRFRQGSRPQYQARRPAGPLDGPSASVNAGASRKSLEAACRSAMSRTRCEPGSAVRKGLPAPVLSVQQRLRVLDDLVKQGLLGVDEAAAKRADILKSL